MCRRIGHKISPRIHVIQKVRDGDWFVLSVQRNIEMPVLEGSNTLSCTAVDASGSLNTDVRSIERAGAPAYSVNAAIGVVTTGATFCAEAVVQIARQKARISVRFLVIGDVLLNPRLGLGKSLAG